VPHHTRKPDDKQQKAIIINQ